MASAHSNIAANYNAKSDLPKMLDHLFIALKLQEDIGDSTGIASSLNNIGIVYDNNGDYDKALEYFTKALKLQQARHNKSAEAIAMGNIGTIYFHQKNYAKVLEYIGNAMAICEEINDKSGIASYLQIIGDVHAARHDYHGALEHYFKALKLSKELEDDNAIATCAGFIGEFYFDIAVSDSIHYKPDSLIPGSKPQMLKKAVDYLQQALTISRNTGYRDGVIDFTGHLAEALQASGDYKGALMVYRQHVAVKDSVFNTENNVKISNLETKREIALKDKQIEIDKLAVAKKRNERGFFMAGIAGILIITVIVFRNYRTQKSVNKLLFAEKQKSEDLLLNILPFEVAEELKEKGVANARHFEQVTVLFTDFVDFTHAGEHMSPQALVDELHACFKAFDDITGKYNIEKIKTVGDAYMAVAGLPTADPDHALNVVRAAIEINGFMQDRIAKHGSNTFHIRIGIHSGSVVAGIVGVKKFAYDIWGDTVNTAARMEQNSQAGKINISQTTYELVKEKINCEYRGEIDAKGKGQLKMYYVLSGTDAYPGL